MAKESVEEPGGEPLEPVGDQRTDLPTSVAGEIGPDDQKRRREITSRIAQLSMQRDLLLKTYREEFKAASGAREDIDREQAAFERLVLNEKVKMSEENIAAARMEFAERIAQNDRIPGRYKQDALELEKQIEALQSELSALDSRLAN